MAQVCDVALPGHSSPSFAVDQATLAPTVSGARPWPHLFGPRTAVPTADGLLEVPRLDLVSPVVISVETPAGTELLVLPSIFRVDAGSTAYVGGGVAADESDVQIAVPGAGSVTAIACATDEDPGAGSYTYTLRRNNTDTALTFSLTGTTRKNTLTGSVAYAAGDWLAVKVAAAGGAPAAHHNCTLKYVYA